MKRIVLILLMFPLAGYAQHGIMGSWRLKESTIVKGLDYTNALPLLITIRQSANIIELESTTNNGEADSISKESIEIGLKRVNEHITKSGMKRKILFYKGEDNVSWIKQTEVSRKGHAVSELRSISKETLRLWPDGKTLSLLREYDSFDDSSGAKDFVIDGVYEKLTPEQLAREGTTGKGVNFLKGVLWEKIQAMAKKENRYIFIDCYATWCRPCKMMDKYVYTDKKVGEVMNEQFISVKVQMDTTKNDAYNTKMYYSLARKLETEYNISALPTYLFFSPNGEPVHKAMGQMNIEKFVEMLEEAKNPVKQLYTLVNKARKGELLWKDYPTLVKRLKEEFGEKDLAMEIAKFYNNKYLSTLTKEALLTKENLDFIGENILIVKSSDNVFKLCVEHPSLVDSIKQYEEGGWANYIVNRTINREEVDPLFSEAEKTGREPDWLKLDRRLSKMYNKDLAITYVLDARMAWYVRKEDWAEVVLYVSEHLGRHDLNKLNSLYLNSCAWYVFKYSNDKALMKEALGWIDIAISKTPKENLWITMDTKACLLYKLGRREEGVVIMEQIIKMFPQFVASFQPRLESMLKGVDIWLTL